MLPGAPFTPVESWLGDVVFSVDPSLPCDEPEDPSSDRLVEGVFLYPAGLARLGWNLLEAYLRRPSARKRMEQAGQRELRR